ncbi:MAG: sugar ABC transporter ATP-binding protein, partial [Lachnospiraceae bacterium]|nr:sugar ABC transporter ATP-binding protein [Lachnospiraceae bacterium]
AKRKYNIANLEMKNISAFGSGHHHNELKVRAMNDKKTTPEIILRMEHIAKSFGPTRALDDVTIDVCEGEIHAILGQNGAGKSTLVNVMDSSITDFEGQVLYRGQVVEHSEMKSFFRYRLGVVHQEFPLIPYLSVAENIYLGELPKNKLTTVNWKKVYDDTESLLENLNIKIDARAKIRDLSTGEKQLVSIARAVAKEPEILVFDEATSTLTDKEVTAVFALLEHLRAEGTGIIFISHKIEEIMSLADRVTILRDGKSVATRNTSDISKNEMIQFMAGREVNNQFPPRKKVDREEILRVEGLSGTVFKDISFHVKSGEVLGIAGLVGSGQPELLKTIFGAMRASGGKIFLSGQEVSIKKPIHAIEKNIYFIPSDRRKECIFKDLSIRDNLTIAMIRRYCHFGKIDHKKISGVTREYIDKLKIKTTGEGQKIKELSGGNQQKVIISRWLSGSGKVFLFDEPTRGLDVGVKFDVYELINSIKEDGGAVVMVSSELPEILAMSDRVIVMYEGNIVAEMVNDNLSQETVLEAIMNQQAKR